MNTRHEGERGRMAIYVVTRHAVALAKRLQEALGEGVDVYYLAHRLAPYVGSKEAHWRPVIGSMRELWAETFARYRCHVPIFSVGAAVRLLAPHIHDKKSDPAVVAIDELGRFAIALLSGHLGGANDWARQLAAILGATPVITTASDLNETLSVDLLGRQFGWKIDPASIGKLTEVAGLVVDRRPVAVVQLAGESEFWPPDLPLPAGISYHTCYDAHAQSCAAALLISDQVDPCLGERGLAPPQPVILYRPSTLVVGIGCDRGFPVEALERNVLKVLNEGNLAVASVRMITSLDLKGDELCLVELAHKLAVPFQTFSALKLDAIQGTLHPSGQVKRLVGTASVAEASALFGAGTSKLILPKLILRDEPSGKHMTIAVARLPHPHRDVAAEASLEESAVTKNETSAALR